MARWASGAVMRLGGRSTSWGRCACSHANRWISWTSSRASPGIRRGSGPGSTSEGRSCRRPRCGERSTRSMPMTTSGTRSNRRLGRYKGITRYWAACCSTSSRSRRSPGDMAKTMNANVLHVVAGALLHEVGKVEAYEIEGGGFGQTPRGLLLGHVALGCLMLERRLVAAGRSRSKTPRRSRRGGRSPTGSPGRVGRRIWRRPDGIWAEQRGARGGTRHRCAFKARPVSRSRACRTPRPVKPWDPRIEAPRPAHRPVA